MKNLAITENDRVLVLGATGFVGTRLVDKLFRKNCRLRLFVRNAAKAANLVPRGADGEVVVGDLVENQGLTEALEGIHTTYYLVHSLGGKTIYKNTEFAAKDKRAARNFLSAADKSGLKRIIYLGGLGEAGENLSDHLKSRAEVAQIISSGKASPTILRAAVIVGAGGASFEMLRYLVERLPVMTCPKWVNTRIQPIAIDDVIEYLVGCLFNPETAGETFDIGGPEVLTYRTMMEQYAEARGLASRFIVTLPLLTPRLSAYWVDLVTPVASGIAHPLIEGMKNEVVCKDNRIDELVSIRKTSFKEAVQIAFSEEQEGPGKTGF